MEMKFENLSKEYKANKVLDIAKGCIEEGSITGIIGSNGAGKSTLVKILAGLSEKTTGDILYNGITDIPYNDMTLVFQTPYLIRTTVENNIAYPLKLRKWNSSDIEKRVDELCIELGLSEFLKSKSWQLSGGEGQKVALARALSFRPKILFLDEPTANIDPNTTAEIERMLVKINETEKTTIVIITHNLVQAKRICNRVMFLNKGILVEDGKCSDILSIPQKEETKRFIKGELLL